MLYHVIVHHATTLGARVVADLAMDYFAVNLLDMISQTILVVKFFPALFTTVCLSISLVSWGMVHCEVAKIRFIHLELHPAYLAHLSWLPDGKI